MNKIGMMYGLKEGIFRMRRTRSLIRSCRDISFKGDFMADQRPHL